MTTLDRLHIEGIRSFGVNEEQAADLKFQCPLTLILGHNGCGKTTIIECLKYAASGDQPPNSRAGSTGGSNFVHFPKSLKLTEVLAQVKLRIRDINGRRSVVTRSMRNTQKLKKVEFKSLDSTICIATKDGPGEAISSRCVDVDRQMSYLLGVSKPILNYVIFCHQEESCWPMEEGKKLKERFDEIFDSAKYNKCMESIRKLKKIRNADVLSMRKDVQLLEVVKWEAEEKMKKLHEEETRMEKTDETVAKCQTEIADIERQLDTLRKKEINIASLVAEKTQNDFKLEELRKTIKEIKTSLRGREFGGDDQQLETEIKSFIADFSKKKDELKKLEDDMKKMGEAEKHVQSQLNDEQNSLGGLKRDVDTNKEAIQTRTALLNQLAGDLQLQEMVSPYSEAQVGVVVKNVERKLREMKRVVETIKVENDDEEMKQQGKIDELREEKAKLEQSVSAKTMQMKDIKSELERVSCDINEVAQSTKTLRVLENKLERNNKELQELLDSVNCAELDKEIRELQRNRERSDEKLFELNKEVDDLIQVTNLRTTLDSCVDRKVACEEELERLYAFRGETLKHVLEVDELPAQNLNQHLDKAISKLTHEMRTSQEEINRKREQLVTLQSDGRHLEEKLRKANHQLSADMTEMAEVCGNESYEEALNRVTEALKTSQDETGMLKASDYFYREYIRKLREPDPCCPLCRRRFEEEDVGSDLANELEERLRHVPAKLSTSEEERDSYAEKLARLQQLKPVNERITLLNDKEIPSMGQACRALLDQISKVKEEISELEMNSFFPCRSREHKGRTIQPEAIAIDQKRSDLASLQREIEELQSQIPTTGKTLQQARNERDQLQFEIENTRKKIEANQAKKINHNERVNKLQNEKNEIVKQQLKVQTGQQQEKQLLDKQGELKELSKTLEKEIVSTSNQVLPIQQKLEEAIRDKEETRKKHRKQMEVENNKTVGYEQRFEEVHKLQNKIEQFERHGVAGKLEKTERNVARMKRDLEAFGVQRSSLQTKQDSIKADLCSRDTRHRDLLDNKKLREKRVDEEKLELTMKEMEDRLGVLDYDAIKLQLNQLKQQADLLNSKKHYAEGRQKELALSVSSLRNEMERPMNKNAVKNFKDKIIDLQVEEAANRDIDAYYSTLDWALKHFHTEKMKSINTIIKELWCKVYRGIDIDYIEIKCDDVEVSSADKKRTYNYRVVQVKDDVELDMRGRCSAGQKMLASIIIRLALAEVFSNNCGIMTLDEPTTNLDRDNIESLSVALVDIVKTQTKHKKFQLVVITHDEDFLLRLTRVEKADYFWKVYKDAEGLSRVEFCAVR